MKKYFLISVAMMLACGIAGCTDDNDMEVDEPVRLVNSSTDVVHGRIAHYVDVDNLDKYRLPLNTLSRLTFTVGEDAPVEFRQVTVDGVSYAEPVLRSDFTGEKVMMLKVASSHNPEMSRNIIVVLYHGAAEGGRAGEDVTTAYSEYIGKGTEPWNGVGDKNIKRSVILYSRIDKLGEEIFTASSTLNDMEMLELTGTSYEETMTQWGLEIGLSGKFTQGSWGEKLSPDETDIIPKHKGFSISGSINVGGTESISTSEAYEYYLSFIKVEKSIVKLNVEHFTGTENRAPDLSLWSVVSEDFVDEIMPQGNAAGTKFVADAFFDEWGTDIIYQGVFGGYSVYIYGRTENTYEEEVGVDANLYLKRSSNVSPNSGKAWADIYYKNNGPYQSGEMDFSYMQNEYFESSKALSYMHTVGGANSLDSGKWLEGFDDSKNWSLISYGECDKDSVSNVYGVDMIAQSLLISWRNNIPGKLCEADSLVYDAFSQKIKALEDRKQSYIEEHQQVTQPKERMVLADVMMKKGKDDHHQGDPQPFVAANPRTGDKLRQLTYYPMMATKYAPAYKGYAVETSDDHYSVVIDDADHYWYYALAPESDVTGIVDIQFKDKAPDGYAMRGDHPDEGDYIMTKNKVCVKYFDKGRDKASQKITAFCLLNKNIVTDGKEAFKINAIVAATGGAELSPYVTGSEEEAWEDFWKNGKYDRSQWNEGSLNSYPVPLWPGFSTDTLRINRLNNHTVTHPKKWGE